MPLKAFILLKMWNFKTLKIHQKNSKLIQIWMKKISHINGYNVHDIFLNVVI
jgi:hypothetical protein